MNRASRSIAILGLVAVAAPSVLADTPAKPSPAALEFFEKKVRPILVDNCYNCHSANTNAKGGLRVDDRNGLLQGGNSGPAVVPGHPEDSLLLKAVDGSDEDRKMPPKKTLSAEQTADLKRWIAEGAVWPQAEGTAVVAKVNPKYETLRKSHWAWQPLATAPIPKVRDSTWPKGDVDRFLLAKLEAASLRPSADADRRTLIRRVSFDLTGLPPTPAEIDAFEADTKVGAFERVVDRLLASPAFGERWGRHWLDVARYAESTGSSRNVPYPHAWRYRDYVVNAFRNDKPFDQFIREQVAGDLLPSRTAAERDERQVATGFLALGVKDVNQRFKVRFVMDNVDEQIDTVTRSVLAVTASCARCHDHKFDPIPTADYYALAGIFTSTDLCAGVRNKMGGGGLDYYDPSLLLTLDQGGSAKPVTKSPEEIDKASKALAKARAEFIALRDSPAGAELSPDGRPKRAVARQKMNKLQNEFLALTDPANGGRVAFGARESKTVGDTEVRLRGEAEKLGPRVPRGFLTIVGASDASKIPPTSSGRLELAKWLTAPTNPLTPRVWVNRVWGHLFDAGLSRSVDNFGSTGDAPSHPELLDHLAGEFVQDGWSVKRLVRKLVLTRAYALGSQASQSNLEADPSNRLVWRHAPRRLDAEEIRDATLAVAGTLELSKPAAPLSKDLKVMELPNNGPLARRLLDEAKASRHRSLYLPLLRGLTPTSLDVFDFAGGAAVTGSRDRTHVAPQALYLLNDPFVRKQSLALASRLLQQSELDDSARLELAYRLVLGRLPRAAESARAQTFLAEYSATVEALAKSAPTVAPKVVMVDALPAKPDGKGATKAPAVPINPDEVVQEDLPVVEDRVEAQNPKAAAWAGFCQALLGSAEFRYVQ